MSENPHITTLKRLVKKVTKFEKIRFALVGGLNTTCDFIVLLLLVSLIGLAPTIANIISTSVALMVSYTLNKKAVFGNTDTNNKRQVILFIVVTLFGLWVLQTIVIAITSSWLATWFAINSTSAIILIVAKVIATGISLTWNYLWYSKVIFSQKKQTKQ